MKPSPKQIQKLRNELVSKQNPMHSTAEIKSWYKKIVKQSNAAYLLTHSQQTLIDINVFWFCTADFGTIF